MPDYYQEYTAIEAVANDLMLRGCIEINIVRKQAFKVTVEDNDEEEEDRPDYIKISSRILQVDCVKWRGPECENTLKLSWTMPVDRADESVFDMVQDGKQYHVICTTSQETLEFNIDKRLTTFVFGIPSGEGECMMAAEDSKGSIGAWTIPVGYKF